MSGTCSASIKDQFPSLALMLKWSPSDPSTSTHTLVSKYCHHLKYFWKFLVKKVAQFPHSLSVFFFFLAAACEILVPLPVIEPRPSAVKTWSPRKVKGKVSVRLFETPWTVARQVPLSMGFSKQEYWSGLPCPLSGDLPDPGLEPVSLTSNLHWQAGSLPLAPPGKPHTTGLPGNSKSGSILESHLAFNLKKKKKKNSQQQNKPHSETVLSVYS